MDQKRLNELINQGISEAEAFRYHELARAGSIIGDEEEDCCRGTPEDHARCRDEAFGAVVAAFADLVKERDALLERRKTVEARASDGYVREVYDDRGGDIDVIQVTGPDGSVGFYAAGPMRASSKDAEIDAVALEVGEKIRQLCSVGDSSGEVWIEATLNGLLASARAAGDARRARPAPVDIAGRWSSPTGSFVFIGSPDAGYVWQDLNTLGSIVGEGEARVVENRVDLRGNNLLAGPVVGTLTLDDGGKLLRGEFCLEQYVQGGATVAVEFLRVST